MAEERNLAVARAVEDEGGDEDATKAELQRRMEEARESITQTVTEIKDTVANQYQAVRQSVTDALDWREQYRRRPVAWSVGAMSVGFLVGYSLGGAFTGDGDDDDEDYLSYDEDYEQDSAAASSSGVSYPPYDSERVRPATGASRAAATPSYAAQSMAGAGGGYSTSYDRRTSSPVAPQSLSDYQPTQGGESEAAEPQKPGVLERFKETKAYDRLQEEVSNLGDRLLDELSTVGQTVVLPALFNKVREMFGVDLSGKQQGQSSSSTGAASKGGAQAAGSSGTAYSRHEDDRTQPGGSVSGGSAGTSYGTSENRGYGSSS